MLARVVLYGNVRPLQVMALAQNAGALLESEPSDVELLAAKQTRLGCSALEFVEMCTLKLTCPSLIDAFTQGLTLPVVEPLPNPEYSKPFVSSASMYDSAYAQVPASYAPVAYNPATYSPSSPMDSAAQGGSRTPPFTDAAVTAYTPKSPTYEVEDDF